MNRYLYLLLILYSSLVFAKDLGVVGETYSIIEEDVLEFIEHRIQIMQRHGEWDQLQNKLKEKIKSHTDRPKYLNISKTIQNREWLFDPSIVLSKNLTDLQGRVFAKKGTTFNPLSVVPLRTALLFIDGDDKDQINWAKNKIQRLQACPKIILIKGSIADTEKIFHQLIYFDQSGRLTSHFHIEHVPVIITQEGIQLKISEEVA